MRRFGDWLKKETVLFGDVGSDGKKNSPESYGPDYSFKLRLRAAFAKTFPATGYDHNTFSYYGDKKAYEKEAYEHYQNFILNPSLNNPAVSFFGITGLSSPFKVFYLLKVPFVTLVNSVRLLTEFPAYVAEAGFRHLFVQSKIKFEDITGSKYKGPIAPPAEAIDLPGTKFTRFFWHIATRIGMVFGAAGYLTFKATRLTLRLVTAPVESLLSAWDVHPALGVASFLLSAAIIVLLAVFAPPIALPIIGKVVGSGAAAAVTKGLSAVTHLFPYALPALVSVGAGISLLARTALKGVRNFLGLRSSSEGAPVSASSVAPQQVHDPRPDANSVAAVSGPEQRAPRFSVEIVKEKAAAQDYAAEPPASPSSPLSAAALGKQWLKEVKASEKPQEQQAAQPDDHARSNDDASAPLPTAASCGVDVPNPWSFFKRAAVVSKRLTVDGQPPATPDIAPLSQADQETFEQFGPNF